MTHWLLVERLENWKIDQMEGFRRFGLPEVKRTLAQQVEKGDTLIFYVSSGISRFSDIREATASGTAKLGIEGDYDTPYPLSISTRPILTLERHIWVPLHGLVSSLSLTSGKADWRQVMRNSLRRLSDEDGDLILNAMKHANEFVGCRCLLG